jgi:hypothetical protein
MRIMLGLMAVALAGAGAGCSDGGPRPTPAEPAGDAARILESTPWLDRAPESETDVVHAWIFPRGEGLYFVGNSYKGSYELFRYFIEDDELRLRFLDEDKAYRTRFQVQRVEDRVFDWKLTLDAAPRGPKVYYGFDQGRALPAGVEALLSRAR